MIKINLRDKATKKTPTNNIAIIVSVMRQSYEISFLSLIIIKNSFYNKVENSRLEKLRDIVAELREKCPWDKKQTFGSLRSLTIEEVYELSDAIILENKKDIEEEVGDLLLHVMFYAQIGEENNDFTINIIIDNLIKKLKERHPHIYGNLKLDTAKEVEKNWEEIKQKKRKSKKVLDGITENTPPLIKALRIQKKVKNFGFDWENSNQVLKKIDEELLELKEELKKRNNTDKIENEIGDLIFSVLNLARFIDIDPEKSLEKTNKKFIRRFNIMESMITKEKKSLNKMSLKQMDVYWEKAKKNEERNK